MKRKLVVGLIIIFTVFIAGQVIASPLPKGDPFQAIWNAIKSLEEQIANIQLIPGPQGPVGPQGPQGERGPMGPQGIQGLPGSPSWDESRVSLLESRLSALEKVTAPVVVNYHFNGIAGNAQLDLSKLGANVSISITASKPVYWYRVWICKKGDVTCGSTFVQYWFVTVPPYITDYVSDSGQWDGKDYKGIPVPNGEYMIRVYIADQENRETRSVLEPYTITVVNSPTQ